MNRKQRQLIKARAKPLSREMAQGAYDCTPTGRRVKVTNPKAVAALQRAFCIMLQNGGEPLVTRITKEAEAAFPRAVQSPADVQSYLAVGLDPDGRGTYSLRCITTPDAPAALEDRYNRMAALSCLRPLTAQRGFSMGAAKGQAQ